MSEFHVEEHKSSAPAPPLTPMRQQRDDDLVRTPPMRIPSLDQTVSDFMRSLTPKPRTIQDVPRDIYDVPTPPTTAERQLFETTPRDMTTDDIPTPPKPIPTLSPPRGTTPPGLRGRRPEKNALQPDTNNARHVKRHLYAQTLRYNNNSGLGFNHCHMSGAATSNEK
jgi:hypothetical protein